MIDVSPPLARTRGFHVALALAFQTYLSFLIMPHTPRMDASRNIARNTILYCTYCMGAKVAIVEGNSRNIKITRPEDIAIGEALLKEMNFEL